MGTFVRFALGLVALVAILAVSGYFLWLHNPHHDTLRLDPGRILAGPDDLLIRNATLIDVEAGAAIAGRSLLVRDGRITAVTIREPALPPGFREIDATGRYVLPGLIDVHAHLRTGGIAGPEALTPVVALEQFVRYGVTTVLVPGGQGGSDRQIAELKRRSDADEIVAPRIFATGSLITVPGSHPLSTLSQLPEDADATTLELGGITLLAPGQDPEPIIRRKSRLGLDGVKIIVESGPSPVFGPNPRMTHEMAAEIVQIAGRHGLPVYAHATSTDEFADAVAAGVAAIIHNMEDTPLGEEAWIERMRRERIFLAPTLSILYGFQYLEETERLDDPEVREAVSPRTLRSLANPLFRFFLGRLFEGQDGAFYMEQSSTNLRLLHEEGVPIALGTDTGMPFVFPGFNAHVEMELMAEAGLSNAEVLRAATKGGAELLQASDLGRLTPGSSADLIVLRENPLEDIRNTRSIDEVVLRGRVIE